MTPAEEFVLDWVSGEIEPKPRKYVVEGARHSVTTLFTTFACLYAEKPRLRVFTQPLPLRAPLLRGPERSLVQMLQLAVVASYDEPLHRPVVSTLSPTGLWTRGVNESKRLGLPMGVYAAGRTAVSGRPRAVLFANRWLSPTRLLRELNKAAR